MRDCIHSAMHRYHPATIAFAMRLLQKVGKHFYETELRHVLLLPSARHLQSKISEVDAAGAGFNTELTHAYAGLADELNFSPWERSGCIATDAMTVRYGLSWNASRGEIGGFDTHGVDAAVILGEFRAASKRLATGEQPSAGAASLTDMNARHYTVYIFTTFGPYNTADGERRAMQWVVYRHAVAHLRPALIADDLKNVVACLQAAGFNVYAVSLDGATENEACARQLCTLSLRDLLDADALTWLGLADADLDFKIAWPHPLEGWPIFFVADMGHVIKRIVNALETSSNPKSKRNLRYVVDAPDAEEKGSPRTVSMSLDMLHKVYDASEVSDRNSAVGGPLALCISRKLSIAHFRKDAHSRMRVPLAVQVLSNTMLSLVDAFCVREADANITREFTGMRELIKRVNRLVDICNCRGEIPNPAGAEPVPPALAINSRDHPILQELASIKRFFTDWGKAVDSCPDSEFPTQQARENAKLASATHKGVQRLILGIIGTAMCHLPENHSHYALNPRRLQSDACEHEFSCVRFDATGGNPTMQNAMRSTAIRGVKVLMKRRRSGSSDSQDELAQPHKHRRTSGPLPTFPTATNKSYQPPAHADSS